MISEKSFRYYNNNKEVFKKFDKGLPKWMYYISIFIYFFIFVTGISFVIKLFINFYVLSNTKEHSGIVSFVFTKNQETVDSQIKKITNLKFDVYNFVNKPNHKNIFSNKVVFLNSLASAKLVVTELIFAKNIPMLFNNSIRIIKLVGLNNILRTILDDKVNILIKYNDHSPYSVLLFDIAVEKSIKTVYVQHAPVSNKFPPLHHDLNVLFSQDSLNKYKIEGNKVKILVLFDVRFASLPTLITKKSHKSAILICPNTLDDQNIVKNLAELLSNTYDVNLRPHPADKRDWLSEKYKVSREPSIWNDLNNVKFVLTNESAVVLEALYTKRLCYKCSFFSASFDNYGFMSKGLIFKDYHSQEDLLHDLNNSVDSCNLKMLPYFIGDLSDRDSKIKLFREEIYKLH